MTSVKWEGVGEGKQRYFKWGEFEIKSHNAQVGTLWIATNNGVEVSRGRDLQEVMDYCERLGGRVA